MKKDLPKFDPLTDRDKANTSVSQSIIFKNFTLHTPAKEINFEFTQTFPLSCSTTMILWTYWNLLELLNALHHLSARHAEVYPFDQLSRVWTRSTVIVANMDYYDQLSQHWSPFTSMNTEQERISIDMTCCP